MRQRDPRTFDIASHKVRLASDLRFWPVHQRGELVCRIEIPKLHRFFRVGYEEYVFLSFLDGDTTIPQACGLAAAKLGPRAPSTEDATAIVRWLIDQELAHLPGDPSPSRDPKRSSSGDASAWAWLRRLNPFWIKLPLIRSDQALSKAASWLGPMFSLPCLVICLGLVAYAATVLARRWNELAESSSSLFVPQNWWGLLIAWVLLKAIHELAHSAACRRFGGQVREAGAVMVLLAPLAYVDVSSCWRMNSRWSRIAVSAAGMYVEIIIAAIALLVWEHTESVTLKASMYQLMVAAGVSTLLFNANVLMRFDGYFILADLIDVPNLYSESNQAIKKLANRVLTGRPAAEHDLGGWRRWFALGYGVLAMAWRVVVCVSLFLVASTMFEGAGIAIACLGIVLWTVPLVRSAWRAITETTQAGWWHAVRPIVLGTAMASAIVGLLVAMPVPSSVCVPSVVQFIPDATVRSRGSGFVRQIHVVDGQAVRAGDRLMELENPELTNRLADLVLKRRKNEIRLRQASEKHDAAEEQLLGDQQVSLDQQIGPLKDQVAALQVTADRDGVVVARGLEHRLGNFVREGDVLLLIAGSADKELIAVIDQAMVDQTQAWVGESVVIESQDYQRYDGTLDRIEPRASDRLPSPALAASEGGPLAVRRVDASEEDDGPAAMRLLEPAFRARVRLEPEVAAKMAAGSTGRVHLGYRHETIAARWTQMIRQQWHRAHLR